MPTNIITETIRIGGMTCVSCADRIERKLSEAEGIVSARVSYASGKAVVSYDPGKISIEKIKDIIEKLDYKVISHSDSSNKFDFTRLAGIIIILFSLYMILNNFGAFQIFNLFPQAKEGMGYGMLFIIGLLTSVHCIAMCGGICLSQCTRGQSENTEHKSRFGVIRPSLLYNLGRVISYTVLGGIVGALGSVISFSGSMKGIVQIIAGSFMVIMGLNMLNIFPWLKKLNPRLPKIFTRKIYDKKRNNSPLYIGLLNGLMPCGPLQAMQIYALSTGSPLKGALAMFLFSIGTVPLMLAFGAVSSLLSKKFTHKLMTVSAVLVMVLGVFMFSSGAALSGFQVPFVSGSSTKSGNIAVIKDGVQTVTTNLSSGRYEAITVQKGIPVKWIIKADDSDINGCNNSMIIPKYNLTHDFKAGDNEIDFTPTESGTIPYSCWMGMIRSNIKVVDDINKVSSTDSSSDSSSGAGFSGGSCCR